MTNKPETFTGTIDQLLDHCSTINTEEMQLNLDKTQNLEYIKKEFQCSDEEAEQILEEITMTEVKDMIDDLIADGLVKIIGHDENGEPLFGLTENGKAAQKILKEDSKKKKK